MEMTWEQFNTAYKNASDDVRAIIDSDALPPIVEEFISNNQQVAYPQVMKVVSRYVLGVFGEKEVVDMIPESQTLISKVNSVLGKENSQTSVPEANNELREKLELRPEGAVPKPPKPVEPPQEEGMKPLTRDEVLQALSPKRTMQSDIAAIKVDDGKE